MPKREIVIELQDVSEQAKKMSKLGRSEFNGYLEEFYNKYGEEEALFVKYHFLARRPKQKLPSSFDSTDVAQGKKLLC